MLAGNSLRSMKKEQKSRAGVAGAAEILARIVSGYLPVFTFCPVNFSQALAAAFLFSSEVS